MSTPFPRGKALFVCYGGGHVTMVAPVVKELEGRGVHCDVLALTTGYAKARRLGLQPLGYRDFQHLVPEPQRVLAWGRALDAGNDHPDVDRAESHWYLGVNYAQWVREHGEAGARQRYEQAGRRGFHPLDFMTAVVRHLRPDVVVTTNSPRSEQAAVEAAGKLSVPALSMVDLFPQPGDAFCRRSGYADRLAVLSPAVKQSLAAAGIDAGRIVVTGNPAFDGLCSPEVLAQARQWRERLGWEGRRVLMYAGHGEDFPGTPAHWQGRGFGTAVQDWLQQWVLEQGGDRHALVVRNHPSDWHLYPPLAPSPFLYRSDTARDPLHPLVLASDVVIVQTSTVGVEASLAGRQVLCLGFAPSVQARSYDYADFGLAQTVQSFEELGRVLADAGPGFRVDPADYQVGKAAGNVAREVLGLIGRPANTARQVEAR